LSRLRPTTPGHFRRAEASLSPGSTIHQRAHACPAFSLRDVSPAMGPSLGQREPAVRVADHNVEWFPPGVFGPQKERHCHLDHSARLLLIPAVTEVLLVFDISPSAVADSSKVLATRPSSAVCCPPPKPFRAQPALVSGPTQSPSYSKHQTSYWAWTDTSSYPSQSRSRPRTRTFNDTKKHPLSHPS
jgi:hypothetical protein